MSRNRLSDSDSVNEDIQSLMQEHKRLRADVERLLSQKEHLLERERENGDSDGGNDSNQEHREGQRESRKEPVKTRLRNWARAHPARTVAGAVVFVLLLAGAVLLWRYWQSYVSTDDAQVDGHTNQIGSRVSGTVVGVYVEDDRRVVPGQLLVDLDPRDYETALDKAQAALQQALAEVSQQSPNVPITQTTQATLVSTSQLDIANAEANVQQAQQSYLATIAEWKQAQADAQNASIEERRYRGLVAKEEVSREQYDQRATAAQAQEALVSARKASADAAQKVVQEREAALSQVREKYQAARTNEPRQVAAQRAAVETRRASVASARAQVEQAKLNLSYCKITAPVAGVIGNKTVEVGQQVAPGQPMLAITPVDDVWVTANFKETQIVDMRPGQGVTIHVDAIDRDFDGYVQNLPGATGARYSLLPPENATGNYVKVVQRLPVRIRFKPGQAGMGRLRPGMSVEPKVWLK